MLQYGYLSISSNKYLLIWSSSVSKFTSEKKNTLRETIDFDCFLWDISCSYTWCWRFLTLQLKNCMISCSMGQQAVMCAQAHSRSCDATFTANSVTAPIETLKADLQSVCREMFSDREASMKDNSTEKCEMAPAVVPCVGNSEMCFNSLVPSEICGYVQLVLKRHLEFCFGFILCMKKADFLCMSFMNWTFPFSTLCVHLLVLKIRTMKNLRFVAEKTLLKCLLIGNKPRVNTWNYITASAKNYSDTTIAFSIHSVIIERL